MTSDIGSTRALFYGVGPVQCENMLALARGSSSIRWIGLLEGDNRWVPEKAVSVGGPLRFVGNALVGVPDVDVVVLAQVQPRFVPMQLLSWAAANGVPTIAIEEVNQLALNAGRVNNYLLPADHVLVASDAEAERLAKAGAISDIHVTGWPYHNRSLDHQEVVEERERLGIDPNRPVALLTLSSFLAGGESLRIRQRQLEFCDVGLPPEWQLFVKGHPVEDASQVAAHVSSFAPRARILNSMTSVAQSLSICDVLLNAGVSQVALEAVSSSKPIIVIDTCRTTLFHLDAPAIVANSTDQLASLVRRALSNDFKAVYAEVARRHIPFRAGEALSFTLERIESLSRDDVDKRTTRRRQILLSLVYAWQFGRRAALGRLSSFRGEEVVEPGYESVRRLVNHQATRADVSVINRSFDGAYYHSIVACLWLDQLIAGRQRPTKEDVEILSLLAATVNTPQFLRHCRKWVCLGQRYNEDDVVRAFCQELQQIADLCPPMGELAQRTLAGEKPVLRGGAPAWIRHAHGRLVSIRGWRMLVPPPPVNDPATGGRAS